MNRTSKFLAAASAVMILGSCSALADQTIRFQFQHVPTTAAPGGKLIVNEPGQAQTWADMERIEADKAAQRADWCRINRCAKEIPLR